MTEFTIPAKFCEFQARWNFSYQKYHCLIGDWQNNNPLCSYASKGDLSSEKGCDIAKCEGELVKSLLGDPTANPPEHAKDFNIIINTPGFRLNYNPPDKPDGAMTLLTEDLTGPQKIVDSILSLKQEISKNS